MGRVRHGIRSPQATAYSETFVTSHIVGATTMTWLRANIASINLLLNDEILRALESIHA